MSQIIKTFLCVFLILLMAATSAGILTAFMEVLNAQDMQARFIDELENSDFAPKVMASCFSQATDADCGLLVTLYYEDGGVSSFSSEASVPSSTSGVSMAKVELTFPFEVRMLGISQEHTFSGYAR